MNKKIIIIPLLLVSLCGCSKKNGQSSSIIDSSIIDSSFVSSNTNSTFESSSSNSSSSEGNSSNSSSESSSSSIDDSSSLEETIITSLSEARIKGTSYKDKVNEVGVYQGEDKVKLTCELLSRNDAITSKKGYTNQYKLLMANEEGYIYINVPLEIYKKLENGIFSYYTFEGYLAYYCGEVELSVNELPVKVDNLNYSLDSLFEEKDIDEVYSIIKNKEVNCKGCNYYNLVKIKAKYLEKMDDKVLLFGNGNKVIQVHGRDKFPNEMTKNNDYYIYASMSMYNYKPGIEYIYSKSCNEEIEIIKNNLENVDSSLNKNIYEVDTNKKYEEYSSSFPKLYKYEGYVNYYTKSNSAYFVLDDENKDVNYSSYESARSGKTLFIKNDSCVNLYYEKDFTSCPLYEAYLNNNKISCEVALYGYNRQYKVWQVYILESSINIINE